MHISHLSGHRALCPGVVKVLTPISLDYKPQASNHTKVQFFSFIHSLIQYLQGLKGSGCVQHRGNCHACQLSPTPLLCFPSPVTTMYR